MRPIVTDRVAWSVCLSVTLVSSAKTDEPSRCRLGCGLGWAQGIMLDGGPDVLRDVVMATNYWLSMGYNFGCLIASDTLFDSRGGFSGSSYPMKT